MGPFTVLVVGGTGFLGTHIVRRLVASAYRVVVLVRPHSVTSRLSDLPITCLNGDVGNLLGMVKIVNAVDRVDAIVYAAGITSVSSHGSLIQSHIVNVVGIQNIIDACRILGVSPHLIVLGTQSDNPGIYAQTKRAGELLATRAHIKATVVRPALVYGPDWRSVFGRLVSMVDRFPVIPVVGSGMYEMKPIYVDDVAEGVERCLGNVGTREVHLSGPDRVSYKQFLMMIARARGRRRFFVHLPHRLIRNLIWMVTRAWPGAPVSMDTLHGLTQVRAYAPGLDAHELGISLTSLEHGLHRTFLALPRV